MSMIERLQEKLVGLADEAKALEDKADADGRHLMKDEQARLDEIFREFDALNNEVKTLRGISARVEDLAKSQGRVTTPEKPGRLPGDASNSGRALFRNAATGETVRALGHADRLEPNAVAGTVGDICAALVRNDFGNLEPRVRNAVTSGGDGGGNYLLTPSFSRTVIDLARAQSVCFRAGAVTLPMDAGEVNLLRLTADPTTAWRGEGASVNGSKPIFGRYTLRAKTCAAIVPVTLEELEDAPNAGMLIEQALQAALGLALDQGILTGTGAGQLLGLAHTAGTNTQTSISTPTDYAEITTAVGAILAANYPGDVSELSWILSPTQGATYDGLVTGIASDKTPLTPTPWAAALRRLMTTTLTTPATMIVGDFREVLVGMRTSGVVLDVLDAGSITDDDGDTFNAATQFGRLIRARIRVDALCMRPSWFSVITI